VVAVLLMGSDFMGCNNNYGEERNFGRHNQLSTSTEFLNMVLRWDLIVLIGVIIGLLSGRKMTCSSSICELTPLFPFFLIS